MSCTRGEPLQGGVVAEVGFVLTKQTGIVGIDLDHCVEGGIVNTWAAGIIESVGGFAELSPSGTGVHIYIPGQLALAEQAYQRNRIIQS